ncbi:MAG: O-antigen ligase family protein [Candidatus Omnitrophica bacterium]|nr:O-antigen ligase family protein [Candidatus Omnitrophota bacterium]
MNNQKSPKDSMLSWAKSIDYAVVAVLSVFCLKYVTYSGRSFAEQFIKFSFLDFPIFVGEFLLAYCLLLCSVRVVLTRTQFKPWNWVLVIFYGFVFIKGVLGYAQYGPLALRDAALFYYSLFILIGYSCYRPDFFRGWIAGFFYLALFWLVFDKPYNDFWLVPRILLGLALAYNMSDRRLGVLMAAAVLIFTPYGSFINTSRSFFLGGFIAIVFLLISVLFLLKPAVRKPVIVCNIFLIVCLAAYIFNFSGSRPAQGLLAIGKMRSFFQETKKEIERKKKGFVPLTVNQVKIFSPNRKVVSLQNDQKPVASSDAKIAENHPKALNNNIITSPDAHFEDADSEIKSREPHAGNGTQTQTKPDIVTQMKLGNSIFRLLLWEDAIKDIGRHRNIFGISFGKPFRSENLEIIRSAVNEWKRDGWIAMHNSYLNILYRGGIMGLIYIIAMIIGFGYMVRTFIVYRSLSCLLVCASLLIPFVTAFFAVALEVPYFAIPIWTLYGFLLRAASDKWLQSKVI